MADDPVWGKNGPPKPKPPNVADLAAARADAARRLQQNSLEGLLAKSDKGVVIPCLSNLTLIVGNDPCLASLFSFNEFTSSPVINAGAPAPLDGMSPLPGPFPRAWEAADVAHVQSYIQRVWTKRASRSDTEDAMLSVAVLRRFHPPRDWLAGLVWDGKPRLDSWLVLAFGSPGDDYHAAVGAKLLIAACRRVRHPGCKFDHMPVFEGAQGLGKSTVLKMLFTEAWFTDALPAQLESKDAALGLLGVWLVEFAEIEQIIRTEVEVIKAFLSRSIDRFRAPYARAFVEHPRQCLLVGTTNESGYLRDASGNRRFWPIECHFADFEWVRDNREQLFAEAAAREAAGEDHWLHEADVAGAADRKQAERLQGDVWEDRIREWLGLKTITTSGEVLSGINVSTERQGKREQMRVGAVLRQLGWERVVRWSDGKPIREWYRSREE